MTYDPDVLFWWTGAVVWMLLGGGAILLTLSTGTTLLGRMAYHIGKAMIGEIGSLGDVAQWIRAGRPRDLSPGDKDH